MVPRTWIKMPSHGSLLSLWGSIISKDDFMFLNSQTLFIPSLRQWYKILVWLVYFHMLSPELPNLDVHQNSLIGRELAFLEGTLQKIQCHPWFKSHFSWRRTISPVPHLQTSSPARYSSACPRLNLTLVYCHPSFVSRSSLLMEAFPAPSWKDLHRCALKPLRRSI